MDKSEVLESLFDDKILKVLNVFFAGESGEFYLREISRLAKVSSATTYRILNKLTGLGILKVTEIKTAKLYSLEVNERTEFLKSIIEIDLLKSFAGKVSLIDGVEQVLLLGQRQKNKANLLILSSSNDNSKIKLLCDEMKEKHDFTVSHMALTKEQYEQMSSMGLYPGNKKVLYSKL